jgi:NADPH2:quinone reductase
MRAATILDGEIVVADRPDPVPGAGEVLVRVRAAGLNGADALQRKGGYPSPPGVPADQPGMELAGEVVGLGPGALRFAEGDRVMAIVAGAAQAELITVQERQLMRVPDGLGWPEAGGLPEVFTTAYDAIFTQGGLAAGQRLLVHGAAGGVGTAAVQLGRTTGAHVTATVRNADLRDGVAALGADAVLDPADFTGGGPYDVILELVGAPNMPGNLKALAVGGHITVIGVGAGFKAEVNLLALMGKRGRISGSTLRPRPLEQKAETARLVEAHVLPNFERGALRVPVAATYPLEQAADAYARFEAGAKLGKVVITAG